MRSAVLVQGWPRKPALSLELSLVPYAGRRAADPHPPPTPTHTPTGSRGSVARQAFYSRTAAVAGWGGDLGAAWHGFSGLSSRPLPASHSTTHHREPSRQRQQFVLHAILRFLLFLNRGGGGEGGGWRRGGRPTPLFPPLVPPPPPPVASSGLGPGSLRAQWRSILRNKRRVPRGAPLRFPWQPGASLQSRSLGRARWAEDGAVRGDRGGGQPLPTPALPSLHLRLRWL